MRYNPDLHLSTLNFVLSLLLFLCLAAETPVQWMFPLMGTTTKSFSVLALNREVRETSSESKENIRGRLYLSLSASLNILYWRRLL